jgi:hypothetical protein
VRLAARAALLACAAVYAGPALAAPGFEELARQAEPVSDLGMLLAPFVDDCRRGPELERLRCESVRASLRARLPARTFLYARDGAEAVPASPFDPRLRGLRLTVVGCLSCKQLVEAAPGERRYVTLKVPTRGPSGGPVAAEVARATVSVASPAEAEKWIRTVQPFLRVELLFHPADQPWTVGVSRGYAFSPVGVRVYNRCTGEVLYSDPPSLGPAPRESQCVPAASESEAEEAKEPPEMLSPAAINEAMAQARPDLAACLADSRMRGTARLAFQVAGSGLPETVTVEGPAAGTPLGECLAAAGMKVKFPAFRGEKQRFKYPVPLRQSR